MGVERDVPVGFTAIRLTFELDRGGAEELDALWATERYCVVYQTIARGVPVTVSHTAARGGSPGSFTTEFALAAAQGAQPNAAIRTPASGAMLPLPA